MMVVFRKRFRPLALRVVAIGLTLSTGAALAAEAYPSRPIRMVLGYAPGGTTDITARLLGAHLTQAWEQQIIVDNRPGGGATIATAIVARAQPDGYTLFLTPSGSHTANPALYKKLPYDTVRDFAPVTLYAWVPNMIVTHPSRPINNLQELIRAAREKPGALTYATPGPGTVAHLSAELLANLSGSKLTHVPYKGGSPALAAIASNEVSIMFAALPSATPFVLSKRIKPIVVTAPRRVPTVPDVPTAAESGMPGLQVMEWYGIFAPARTPTTVIDKIHREIVRILAKPEILARFAELGTDPVGSTPAELAKQVESDMKLWANVTAQAGIRAE